MTLTRRDSCRLCSGPLRTVLELEPTPPANALVDRSAACVAMGGVAEDFYPLTLAQCEQCRHVQLREALDPSLLFTADYAYQSATSPVFREHLQRLARQVQAKLFPGDLVVEIGSNDGYLLQQFDPHFRTLGVDPASALAAEATKQGRLTYPGFFNVETAKAIERATGRASRILALNVLAHADDLAGIADGCRALLAETGELIFEVAYLPAMLRDGSFDMCYHEHQHFWHLSPAVAFFAAHSLYLFDAELVPTQGGSVRCYLARKSRPISERLAELLRCERETCGDDALAKFVEHVACIRRELPELLAKLKADGKRIAGFGCPAKATTLLHACGIGRETLDYLVEEAPSKVGKFSPGKHVPIVGVEHFRKEPPDYAVIFCWNFAPNVMNRFDWFVEESGGRWVLPMPEVRVVDG